MADQHIEDDNFYSEVMSPSDLLAARARSSKMSVRGQKDFHPDSSQEQQQRMKQSLSEHWSLVAEERVERLGNLVKGCWIPEEHLVELQSPAGKFWQTMGFSYGGRQYLLPEEALYLMECGSVQVFHEELPLSLQDGYETFLSGGAVGLQQYQVFAHLKRLGYVVHRFHPSSEASSYIKQLNLPPTCDKAGLKRKRSVSPHPSPLPPPIRTSSILSSSSTSSRSSAPLTCSGSEADGALNSLEIEVDRVVEGLGDRTWWKPDSPEVMGHTRCPRWDFSSIIFPDLGSPISLPPPDPALLPGRLTVQACNVAPWRQQLNMREVKTPSRDRRNEDHELRQRLDINTDQEVLQCRNWMEYQRLLARPQARRVEHPAHLWNQEATPLHHPADVLSTAELLETIRVIPASHLLDGASRLEPSDEWRISFNVYHPDTVADFKKSRPGKPHFRICVCSFNDPVPDLRALKLLALQTGDVQVVIAVVDHGDICFYTFKDFQLPTDIFP